MVLTIGTDCSGIEAPIQAIKQLHLPFIHKWACEIDKYARQSILANYAPEILYEDITKRDVKKLPNIDLYICGFPCQPFSLIGNKQGVYDKRSNIMLHCIDVIKVKKPTIFILENVKNFRYIQDGIPFNYLLKQLNKLKTYSIVVNIMNTKDYGIPQNRDRLYIIGINKDKQIKDYVTPSKQTPPPLDDFILDENVYNNKPCLNARRIIKRTNLNVSDNNIIACSGYGNYMKNMSPTITCTTKLYLTKYKRNLSLKEKLLLQGFPSDFQQVVSDSQFSKQIGNSMSVNVIKAVLKELLKCVNLN